MSTIQIPKPMAQKLRVVSKSILCSRCHEFASFICGYCHTCFCIICLSEHKCLGASKARDYEKELLTALK